MPHKDLEVRRAYIRDWKRRDRRERGLPERKAATARAVKRQMVAELKDKPCVDCGGRFPSVCMDFDHRDPSTKIMDVAALVGGRYAMETILAEIAKCDLVCANCHRIRSNGGLVVNVADFLRAT